jgi:hypothetical protein
MKSRLFFLSALFVFSLASDASNPVDANVVTCPQNVSGVFTLYGSNDVVQNGVKWNYGPYNQYTPVSIQLSHINTTNQIGGMTPGLVMGPAVVCEGEVNGAKFIFMTNPLTGDEADDPNFQDYPVGTIGWAFTY